MKRIIIIVLSFTIFWACKENGDQNSKTEPEPTSIKNDSALTPQIKVFTIVHDSTSINDTEQLTELINGLDKSYKEDKHIQDEEFITESLDSYKRRKFAKHLAKELENESFTKAIQTNVSFLVAEHDGRSGSIKVEEWIFKEESTAISCFESLPRHLERSIRYKFISWIWVRQKNKLFLVFTMDYNVDSEPMQTTKQYLTNFLKENGEYEVFEMH